MKKNFYDVNDAGLTFLWAVITPQIIGTIAYVILMLIASDGDALQNLISQTFTTYALLMLTQLSIALVFFIYNRKINFVKASKIYKLSAENILLCILIGLVALIGLTPISNLSVGILENMGLVVSTELPININNIWSLLLAIFMIAFIPAVVEELVFRGVILQGLRKFGVWPAILGSSILFALLHASVVQLVYTFLFGIILAVVVIKTGSIISAMICHFVANASSLIISYFNTAEQAVDISIDFTFAMIAILMTIFTFTIVFSLVKNMKNQDKVYVLNPEDVKELKEIKELANLAESGTNDIDSIYEAHKNGETSENQDIITNHTPNNSTYYLKLGVIVGIVVWFLSFLTLF